MSELLNINLTGGDGIEGGTGGTDTLNPRAGGEMDDGTGGLEVLNPQAILEITAEEEEDGHELPNPNRIKKVDEEDELAPAKSALAGLAQMRRPRPINPNPMFPERPKAA